MHFSKGVPVFYTSIMNYGLVYRSKKKSRFLLAIIAILAFIALAVVGSFIFSFRGF